MSNMNFKRFMVINAQLFWYARKENLKIRSSLYSRERLLLWGKLFHNVKNIWYCYFDLFSWTFINNNIKKRSTREGQEKVVIKTTSTSKRFYCLLCWIQGSNVIRVSSSMKLIKLLLEKCEDCLTCLDPCDFVIKKCEWIEIRGGGLDHLIV